MNDAKRFNFTAIPTAVVVLGYLGVSGVAFFRSDRWTDRRNDAWILVQRREGMKPACHNRPPFKDFREAKLKGWDCGGRRWK